MMNINKAKNFMLHKDFGFEISNPRLLSHCVMVNYRVLVSVGSVVRVIAGHRYTIYIPG